MSYQIRFVGNGLTFELTDKQYRIGSSKKCDIVLNDERISDEHAMLLFQKDRWAVIDLKSENGTFVNNEQISYHYLNLGDEIRFNGHQTAVYEMQEVSEESDLEFNAKDSNYPKLFRILESLRSTIAADSLANRAFHEQMTIDHNDLRTKVYERLYDISSRTERLESDVDNLETNVLRQTSQSDVLNKKIDEIAQLLGNSVRGGAILISVVALLSGAVRINEDRRNDVSQFVESIGGTEVVKSAASVIGGAFGIGAFFFRKYKKKD